MNGRAAISGYNYQTNAAILCFLEHQSELDDFTLYIEPPKDVEIGDIVDIIIETKSNGEVLRKKIQVKKTVNPAIAKNNISGLILQQLDKDCANSELWFAEHISDGKLELVDKLDKLKDAIQRDGFAENQNIGNIGNSKVVCKIDSAIPTYNYTNKTLIINNIKILKDEDICKDIKDSITTDIGVERKNIISNIIRILNETIEYRKQLFIKALGLDAVDAERLHGKANSFFSSIIIRRISKEHIESLINNLLPYTLHPDHKEAIIDALFAHFYRASEKGTPITINGVINIIISIARGFGVGEEESRIIRWGTTRSGRDYSMFDSISDGNYEMGGNE